VRIRIAHIVGVEVELAVVEVEDRRVVELAIAIELLLLLIRFTVP
jgi:hypothetical protein